MLGRDGIPAIRALIEDILDWPLAEGAEFRLAEAVHMREFPTEHGREACDCTTKPLAHYYGLDAYADSIEMTTFARLVPRSMG